MKHNISITILILAMFVTTQFIGLYVANSDPFHMQAEVNGTMQEVSNPALSWIQPPEIQQQSDFGIYFGSIIVSFIIAILLLFFLTKFKINIILRIWFFVVVSVALFITFNAFLPKMLPFMIAAGAVALVLGFFKVFRRNFIVHNVTELLIYPGIAAIFVPILNVWSVLVFLILISAYDIWAVWHSGIMQKMAKYQINNLKIFAGFFVPYMSRKVRAQLAKMKKMKNSKKSKIKNKKLKIGVAILGGGDVVFPLITAAVVLKAGEVKLPFGLHPFTGGLVPAIFVIVGATLGLAYLLLSSEKKKFYPAMPFITTGILIALILSYLFF